MGSIEVRKKYYCRLFDQTYSRDGRLLAVCNNHATISIFDLDKCLSVSCTDTKMRLPSFQLTYKNHATSRLSKTYALTSTSTHLICGDSHGSIIGYNWSELIEQKSVLKPAFRFVATASLPNQSGPFEVNCLKVSDDGERLVSGGAGDNALKIWDLEHFTLTRSLEGHSDYIHAFCLKSENEMVSASEDGTVKLWDTRTRGGCVHSLKPSANDLCRRDNLGAWIGCLDVGADWLVCGGGPALGIWHLSSLSCASVLNTGADMGHHAVLMHDNKILSGGMVSKLYQWDNGGRPITTVDVNPNTIYNIAANTTGRNEITTCCGSSSQVDVFINLGYKSFSLETCPISSVKK